MSVLLRLVLINFKEVPLTEYQKEFVPLDGTEMPPNHFHVRWVNWHSEPRFNEMICIAHEDAEDEYNLFKVKKIIHMLDRNPPYIEIQLDIDNTELNLVMAREFRETGEHFFKGFVLEEEAVDL